MFYPAATIPNSSGCLKPREAHSQTKWRNPWTWFRLVVFPDLYESIIDRIPILYFTHSVTFVLKTSSPLMESECLPGQDTSWACLLCATVAFLQHDNVKEIFGQPKRPCFIFWSITQKWIPGLLEPQTNLFKKDWLLRSFVLRYIKYSLSRMSPLYFLYGASKSDACCRTPLAHFCGSLTFSFSSLFWRMLPFLMRTTCPCSAAVASWLWWLHISTSWARWLRCLPSASISARWVAASVECFVGAKRLISAPHPSKGQCVSIKVASQRDGWGKHTIQVR